MQALRGGPQSLGPTRAANALAIPGRVCQVSLQQHWRRRVTLYIVSSGVTRGGQTLLSGDTMIVSSGGVASLTTVNSGATISLVGGESLAHAGQRWRRSKKSPPAAVASGATILAGGFRESVPERNGEGRDLGRRQSQRVQRRPRAGGDREQRRHRDRVERRRRDKYDRTRWRPVAGRSRRAGCWRAAKRNVRDRRDAGQRRDDELAPTLAISVFCSSSLAQR